MYRIEIEVIIDPRQRRQIVVFKRDDNSFGFELKYYFEDKGWLCIGRYQDQVFMSIEETIDEARKIMNWEEVAV